MASLHNIPYTEKDRKEIQLQKERNRSRCSIESKIHVNDNFIEIALKSKIERLESENSRLRSLLDVERLSKVKLDDEIESLKLSIDNLLIEKEQNKISEVSTSLALQQELTDKIQEISIKDNEITNYSEFLSSITETLSKSNDILTSFCLNSDGDSPNMTKEGSVSMQNKLQAVKHSIAVQLSKQYPVTICNELLWELRSMQQSLSCLVTTMTRKTSSLFDFS